MFYNSSMLSRLFDAGRFRVQFDQSAENFAEILPWALLALGVWIVTWIVTWLCIKLGAWFVSCRQRQSGHVAMRWKRWRSQHSRPSFAVTRTVTMAFAVLVLIAGTWIAAHMAGFNLWTVFLGYGMVTLIMTYTFGPALQLIGAYFLISITDKIEEDFYVTFPGRGVEGRVTGIHVLWIELQYVDPVTKAICEIQVPTTDILTSTIRHEARPDQSELYSNATPVIPAASRIQHGLKSNIVPVIGSETFF